MCVSVSVSVHVLCVCVCVCPCACACLCVPVHALCACACACANPQYAEQMDLVDLQSVTDDPTPDSNLEQAKFNIRLKDKTVKFTVRGSVCM